MLIKKSFPSECDACGAPGPHPLGAAAMAQGATGRWCEVLWLCRTCADELVMTAEEAAYLIISGKNDLTGWWEFDYDASTVATMQREAFVKSAIFPEEK